MSYSKDKTEAFEKKMCNAGIAATLFFTAVDKARQTFLETR